MKKASKILIAAIAAFMTGACVVGCEKGGNDTPTPVEPEESDYKISITAPTGITATSDKERAKKGEEVTITITSIASGYSIKEVTLNSSTVLSESSTNVYKFTMPNQSASILITATVTGDVTLIGDSPAVLTQNETTGVYELKNFLVTNGSSETSRMAFKVNDTVLPSTDFNTYKSFGDITLCYEDDYAIEIATNCYYDFYYDPSINDEGTCYIQRVGVEALPNSADALASIFVTTWGPGAEYCYNVDDLLGMHYEVINVDGSDTTDYVKQTYDWKKYKDNKAFGVCVDKDQMDEETVKYVYKALDAENKSLTVVDTYDYKNGNLTANDDPTRESYNDYGAYSAKYGIISGDDYDYKRYNRNMSHAENMLNTTAHSPVTYLEREIMYSYRVGVDAGEDATYSDVQISSTRNADDSFNTTLKTVVEYDHEESTYYSAKHYAIQYSADMVFTKKGALSSISFKQTQFSIYSSSTEDEWDTSTHQPKTGKKGTVKKKINATYTYGEATEELTDSYMNSQGFVLSSYFLSEITELQIYNSVTKVDSTDGKSTVHLGDDIMLLDTNCVLDDKVIKFSYAPSTALDLWEYGITSSSNESVIKKESNDLYPQVSAVGKGTSTVTFTNHHSEGGAAGITYSMDITVVCVTKVREFYLSPVDDPYNYVTSATPMLVKSGYTGSYTVYATPTSTPCAPREYHAVSSNNSIATVTSADNAAVLTIKFGAVTTKTMVTITMEADYDTSWGGGNATVFTFYVVANDIDPVGTWGLEDDPDNARITFTNEAASEEGWKKGSLFDNYGTASVTGSFIYYYDGLSVTCQITSITVTGSSYTWSTDPEDWELVVQYDAESGDYGVGLAECAYDDYYESTIYSAIWGDVDEYEGFTTLWRFKKVNA